MKTAYEEVGVTKRTNSKRGARDAAVKTVLKQHGKPATVNHIESLLPKELRIFDHSIATTRASCNKLYKKRELKRWGGTRTKQFMYGLPEHNAPDAFLSPLKRAHNWVRGGGGL